MASRVVVLDTETTGFSPQWDRLVEFGAVEVEPRTGLMGAGLHYVINPLQPIPSAVTAIHGVRDKDVHDKRPFAGVATEIASFLRGAVLVIQNAAFDVAMLNAEFRRVHQPSLEELDVTIVDVLDISRNVFPLLPRHDLDSICDHVGVSRKERAVHGAFVDVRLLAATLPYLASGYDAWRSTAEDGCAIELDQFERTLDTFSNKLSLANDGGSAEAIERRISQLAAADRWISATTRWFESVGSELLSHQKTYSCKHWFARWRASVSTSWKGIATEHLSSCDLKKYRSEAVIRTYMPKPDDAVTESLAALRGLFQNPAVTTSMACVLRGLIALRSARGTIESARTLLRRQLLQKVDFGYRVQYGSLRESVRDSTNYKKAVADLCPDANCRPHESETVSLRFGVRNSEACEVLFS